jgi:hypothetical protein
MVGAMLAAAENAAPVDAAESVTRALGAALGARSGIGSLRNARRIGRSLAEQAEAVNIALAEHSAVQGSFITAVLGRLDLRRSGHHWRHTRLGRLYGDVDIDRLIHRRHRQEAPHRWLYCGEAQPTAALAHRLERDDESAERAGVHEFDRGQVDHYWSCLLIRRCCVW